MPPISSNISNYGKYSLSTPVNEGMTKKPTRTYGGDRVNISKQAAQLESTYNQKKSAVDNTFAAESKALEREYIQDKRQIELEFQRKKQSLGRIDIYA